MIDIQEKIVEIAKTKVGIPFHHIGRNDFGYDCAGLFLECLKQVNRYEEDMDLRAYGRNPEGNKIAKIFNKYFDKIGIEDLKNGDALLFKYVNNPQHIAIFYELEGKGYMIHAYGDPSVYRVVDHIFDESWRKRFVMGYRLKNQ